MVEVGNLILDLGHFSSIDSNNESDKNRVQTSNSSRESLAEGVLLPRNGLATVFV